jgi:4-hydroxy-2-oxoglutarate aldolase
MSSTNKTHESHVPPSGVWCPAVTLFDKETDTLDLPNQKKYFKYLSETGLAGLVILGTNAEAFLVTREERYQLIAAAREAVGPSFPLMAGVGSHSTRQGMWPLRLLLSSLLCLICFIVLSNLCTSLKLPTSSRTRFSLTFTKLIILDFDADQRFQTVLENIDDAVKAGADYVLVLPPAYFGKATTNAVISSFFDDVAAHSPLPIVIYNFPGVCNGVDLDSDMITSIAKKHSNVVGVKLTCGSVAKITRLGAAFTPSEFATFGGQSDFLIGGLAAGSSGCIAAFANIFPKTIVKIYDLYQKGKFEEALKLHQQAALVENVSRQSIGATKFAAALTSAREAGIEGATERMEPRRPYGPPADTVKQVVEDAVRRLREFEGAI